MSESVASSNVENISNLPYLPPGYRYLVLGGTEEKYTFRIKEVTDAEKAKTWLDLLNQHGYVTWRVRCTYPRCGRIYVFRKEMRCQHNTDARSSRGTMGRLTKNTNCPAWFNMCVYRTDIKYSRQKKPDPLAEDWPCVVVMKNEHNHQICSTDVLRFRDMSPETREQLLELFEKGHSPSSAKHCLEMNIYLDHPDDYLLYESDGSYLPTASVIGHLYNHEIVANRGEKVSEFAFDELLLSLQEYSDLTGAKTYIGKTANEMTFVCLCTPVMLRLHEHVMQSSDILYVDLIGGSFRQKRRVYFFTCSSPMGALPLGIIITECDDGDLFREALGHLIQDCFPESTLTQTCFPKLVLTASDMSERNQLAEVFPASALLFCQFGVLRQVWQWIADDKKNNIQDEHKHDLYLMFKSLVYSDDEDKLFKRYNYLTLTHDFHVLYPNFINYINQYWEARTAWACCYRKDLPTYNGDINYYDLSFRWINEAITNRVLLLNLTQLVHYLTVFYDRYVVHQIILYVQDTINIVSKRKFLPTSDKLTIDNVHASNLKPDVFVVSDTYANYEVDMSYASCQCDIGKSGKICIHVSAALEKVLTSSKSLSDNSLKEKSFYLRVATNSEISDEFIIPSSPVPGNYVIDAKEEIIELDQGGEKEFEEMAKQHHSSESLLPKFESLMKRMQLQNIEQPLLYPPVIQEILQKWEDSTSTSSSSMLLEPPSNDITIMQTPIVVARTIHPRILTRKILPKPQNKVQTMTNEVEVPVQILTFHYES